MAHLPKCRGRLAPSPTGLLHLGNAWSFLLAWLEVRAVGGEVLLRMEDIDPQRSRWEFADAIVKDLLWLGLDWDFGPGAEDPPDDLGPFLQSRRGPIYAAILERLEARNLTYPCFCSRKELRNMAGAPHIDDRGAPYPGTCRNLSRAQRQRFMAEGRHFCIRLRCPDETVRFEDAIWGPQCQTLDACGGDFALRRSDGVVAYHLAAAADDAHMGITHVLRGRDILPSTPRQILLLRLLGQTIPQYAHTPLLLDAEGQRLAKRHKSLSLRALREAGAEPRQVIGLLGYLAGLHPSPSPATPGNLLPRFSLARLPRHDIRLSPAVLSRWGLADNPAV